MNINQLMKQAQTMQKQMQEMQTASAAKEFTGKAGGDLVTILVSGDGKMKKVNIDSSLLQADEKEILEDLIVAAYSDAKNKAEEDSKQSMSGMFGKFGGMPPGFGF